MKADTSEVKVRISLRGLFGRNDYVLKRSDADLVCLSPDGRQGVASGNQWDVEVIKRVRASVS